MRSVLISFVMVLGVVFARPPAASCADAPDSWPLPAWATMSITGNKASLCRLAGVSEHLDAGRLTLEFIRLLHGERLTGEAPADRPRAAILSYLDTLDAFNRAVAAARMPELSSVAAARARSRDRHAVLAFLGITFDPNAPTPWREIATSDGGDASPAPGRRDTSVQSGTRAEGRREILSDAGLSLQDLAGRLNKGQAIPLALPRVTLPLPLPARLWREVIFHGKVDEDGLFGAWRDDAPPHVSPG